MGFKKVYKALQEIFPEVDSRALRAVAIEHSKDADTAVEVVLTEVIPFLTEKSRPPSSSSERSMVKPPEVAVDARAIARTDDALLINATGSDEEQNSSSIYGANAGHHQSVLDADAGHDQLLTEANGDHVVVNGSDEEQNSSSIYDANAGHHQSVLDAYAGHHQLLTEADGDHVEVNGECASGDLSEKSQETNTVSVPDQTSDLATSTVKDPNAGASHMNNALHASVEASDESFGLDYVTEAHKDSDEEKSNISLGQAASSNVQDIMFTPECDGELIVVPDMLNFDSQYSEPSYSINTASKKDTISEMVDIADDSTLNTMVTRSGQICSVDLLEGIIADARSNKKTLFSAMESVISLMREVELQEKAAEQAKEAAAKGGLDILSRVEDLKKMLQHAKEANDMHTGEVYGERAILATEVRELQSRLLNFSEERDKSLAVLDEMHQTLVSRLEEAEKERKVAEKEKLEKEESARKALSEQEFVMEKVVQEANMLKQEAEENAKLREFLMDRGRVVDMLQGEISVICQDVRLLKEKFDERIPFSKSLSSSQTSCILASSSSSFKSMTPDQVDQVPDQSDSSENLKKSDDLIPSPNEQQFSGGPTAGDDRKALMDEGWEIFENGDYM